MERYTQTHDGILFDETLSHQKVEESRRITYENIRYGMLVEVLKSSGYHAGCKVHFYNKKGVLVGNYYEFLPYELLRKRLPNVKSDRQYQRFFYRDRFEIIKNALFKVPLYLCDKLIRFTQKYLD